MKELEFHSCLSEQFRRFIALRRLSGADYGESARLLSCFDRFLVEQHFRGPSITHQIVDRYMQSLSRLHPRGQANRLCVVRQLCAYITRTDPGCYVPEPMNRISSQTAFKPHIFTKSQILALLRAALMLPPSKSLRPHTYHTLLGVLYTTGMRIGEAFALKINDFHKDRGLLYIAEGKFRKARWVVLHPSVCHVVERYMLRRMRAGSKEPDQPLLINLRGHRLRHCTVYAAFRQLLAHCGITHNRHTGPRIHDLRHTFAVHRLLAWYRGGQDVNARLPALSTYMGHVDVNYTRVYLRPTAELTEVVANRFRDHYLNHVRPQEARS